MGVYHHLFKRRTTWTTPDDSQPLLKLTSDDANSISNIKYLIKLPFQPRFLVGDASDGGSLHSTKGASATTAAVSSAANKPMPTPPAPAPTPAPAPKPVTPPMPSWPRGQSVDATNVGGGSGFLSHPRGQSASSQPRPAPAPTPTPVPVTPPAPSWPMRASASAPVPGEIADSDLDLGE